MISDGKFRGTHSVTLGYNNSYKTTSSTAEVTPTTIITIDTETPIDQKDLVQQ